MFWQATEGGCAATSSIGAIGQMIDISCLYGQPEFATIQTDAYNIWNSSPETDPLSAGLAQTIQAQFGLTIDGQHYFANQNGVLEAVWDLTSSGPFSGNPGAIVFAHKVQTADSPDGPNNIAWVELKKDSGELANTVYRVNTVQGQPPSSVSSSINWCPSCSINVIRFIV
jgi:hypothetical protein